MNVRTRRRPGFRVALGLAAALGTVAAAPAATSALPSAVEAVSVTLAITPRAGSVPLGTGVTATARVRDGRLPTSARIVLITKRLDVPGQKAVQIPCGFGRKSCRLGPIRFSKPLTYGVQAVIVVRGKVIARSPVYRVKWVRKTPPAPTPKPTPIPSVTSYELVNVTVDPPSRQYWTVDVTAGIAHDQHPTWDCTYTFQVPKQLTPGTSTRIVLEVNCPTTSTGTRESRGIDARNEWITTSPNSASILTPINGGASNSTTLTVTVPEYTKDYPNGTLEYVLVTMTDGFIITYTYRKGG
jgi:hypothetical protein